MTIKTLKATFDIPLLPHQIPKWRGAVAEHAGWDDDNFHNHIGAKERVHYRYPTICYRVVNEKAALWAFGEGVAAAQDMLLRSDGVLRMDHSNYPLRLLEFHISDYTLSMPDAPQSYFLDNWLALNAENFKIWNNLPSLTARTAMLEQVLASNIIAFAKAVHWQLPIRLEVSLLHIRSTHTVKHKGILMVAFDVSFSANIFLPEGLGLGKSVSLGFGVVDFLRVKKPRIKKQMPALILEQTC